MSTEAKVGSFTLISLALLAFIVIHLSGFSFGGEKGYHIQVLFKQVNGLKPAAFVRYAGVEVGSVKSVDADGLGASVKLRINPGIDIPSHALVTISSDGLMGEKFINILPGDIEDTYLLDGAVVQGVDERGMEYLMANAGTTLDELQKLIKSLNDVLGNEQVKNSMVESAKNIKTMTDNFNQMSIVMERMAVNNEQDLHTMVTNLSMMSQSAKSAADGMDKMIRDFSQDGQTAEQMRQAIVNLSSTSRRIENMAANLEPVVADPQTAQDLKVILTSAKNVTAHADTMMSQVSNIKVEPGIDFLYSGGKDQWLTNFDLKVSTSPNQFLLLGVDDIGGADQTNLQLGSGNDVLTGRVGIIDSKVGIGLDSYINDQWKFSIDAYDPNDIRLKFRAQYEFMPDTYLVGQTNNVNKSAERATYFGIRRTF
jgi:phospholipid/cholesterol/gamma-HCH transport system substrate-binding protein